MAEGTTRRPGSPQRGQAHPFLLGFAVASEARGAALRVPPPCFPPPGDRLEEGAGDAGCAPGAEPGAGGRRAASPWPRSGCRTGRPGCARSPSCSVRVAGGCGTQADALGPGLAAEDLPPPPPALIGWAPPAAPALASSRAANPGTPPQNAAGLQHQHRASPLHRALQRLLPPPQGSGDRAPERRGWRAPGRTIEAPLALGPRPGCRLYPTPAAASPLGFARRVFLVHTCVGTNPISHPERPTWTPPSSLSCVAKGRTRYSELSRVP